jgi:hypothetical protein
MVDHVYAQPVLPLLDQDAGCAAGLRLLVDREPDANGSIWPMRRKCSRMATTSSASAAAAVVAGHRHRLLRADPRGLRRAP